MTDPKADTAPEVSGLAAEGSAATQLDAMVTAYLEANDAYWRKADELHAPIGRWRAGTSREATRVSLLAALAAVPQQAPQPAEASEKMPLRDVVMQELKQRKCGEPVLCTWPGCRTVWKAALAQQVGGGDSEPTAAFLESLVVWKGDPNDPYFNRIDFGRAVWRAACASSAAQGEAR